MAQTGTDAAARASSCRSKALPLTLQFLIAMVAHAINERLARRIEYVLEENWVLRGFFTETTGRKRLPLTGEHRRRLAIKGKALTPE